MTAGPLNGAPSTALWESLKHTRLRDDFDFDGLLERAARQLQRLEAAHRLRAPVLGERTTRQ